jgi:hypothetical protein
MPGVRSGMDGSSTLRGEEENDFPTRYARDPKRATKHGEPSANTATLFWGGSTREVVVSLNNPELNHFYVLI